jgi:hypothetical protein
MFKELLSEDIEKGIKGDNMGIPTGFSVLDSNINGIQKSLYTIVGGNSGTGKTSFVDLAYVLNPYKWITDNKGKTNIKIKWIYNSMERNTKYKLAKWVCLKIFQDHGIVMDVPTMLGWQGKKFEIDDKTKDLIFKTGEYFDEMFNSGVIDIIDGSQNPTGIFNYINEFAKNNGDIVQVNEFTKRYIPHDPNLYVIIINDHIGKLNSEINNGSRLVDKALLDKHSEYMGSVRDKYGFTVIDISQFNRSIGSTERMKVKSVSPEPDDFKGSGDMYENADIALGLFNPFKLKINDFLGYDIPRFVAKNGENRFRSISIIKNSYGADDVIIGLNFLGENGNFRELPTSDSFSKNPEYYKRAVDFIV